LADVLRSQRRLGAIVHDAVNDELYPAAREFLESLLLQKPGSVFVSADYDVDGVTSAAILGRLFRSLGIRCAASLPCRFTDGYGVNYKDAAARFSSDPFDLLVTADCGGADTARLKAFAAQINRRVFVLDHHLAETVVDDGNLTVLNPAAGGRSPQYCAAVLCALVVRAAVAERLVSPEFLAEMEMLAGLAVVADCVRVDGIAARHCLDLLLRKGAEQGPPGIRGLFVAAGLSGQISTADVAFKLAPMLNAAGENRIGSHSS
jgi:single-stranded-DNA-specific exonuclease